MSLQFNCKLFKDRGQVSCLLNNSSQPQTTHAQPSTVRQLIYLVVKTRVFSESQAFSNVFLKCAVFFFVHFSTFLKFYAMTLHYLLSRKLYTIENLERPTFFFMISFLRASAHFFFLMPPKAIKFSLNFLSKPYACISYCS